MENYNPIDRLVCIAEQLRLCLGDLENANWLLAAIDAHIHAGESLDEMLGLVGDFKGSSAPRFEVLRRDRNWHLRNAFCHLGGSYRLLAEEIRRFEGRHWPIYRYREAPEDWPAARVEIWRAFRLMPARMPSTARGLREALTGK